MLVLTRKQNEKIRIGSSIVITVVKMKGKSVRIGIEAPNEVNILRGELVFDVAHDAAQSEEATEELAVGGQTAGLPSGRKSAKPVRAQTRRDQTNHWPAENRDPRSTSSVGPVDLSPANQSPKVLSSWTI